MGNNGVEFPAMKTNIKNESSVYSFIKVTVQIPMSQTKSISEK